MDGSCDLFVLHRQYPGGGKVWLMPSLEQIHSDYYDILAIANYLAEEGHEVKMLHAIHYKDSLYRRIYGNLIGTRYYRKCPDLLVDGDYYEYESYKTDHPKRAFRNMLHNGLAQSANIIIHHCDLTDGYMLQQIHGQVKNGVPVANVWIFNGKTVRQLYNTEGQR